MSDPVSNSEIESVLSSIRRLVSEEPSPLLRRKRVAEAVKERFVLTPALRVTDAEEPDGAGPDGTAAGPQAGPDDLDLIADLVQQDGAKDTTEASGDDASGADAPDDPAEDLQQVDPAPAASRPERRVRFGLSSKPPADSARLAAHRQTLEERIAELESALQHAPDEWEPDGSEVSATESSSLLAFDLAQPRPKADQSSTEADTDEADAADDDGDQQTDLRAEQPEDAPDGGPEADAAPRGDGHDDDDDGTLPESLARALDDAADAGEEPGGSAQAWIDDEDEAATEHAASGPQTDETEETDEPGEPDEPDEDLFTSEAVLDEDALRDMVAQLVRAELTGALGEQITRNVRRLVRREIQRALAVRELE